MRGEDPTRAITPFVSRGALAALVVGVLSTTVHGCTYVACAGFLGAITFMTVCVPTLASITTLAAAFASWRYHRERTVTSRVTAFVAIGTSALGALAYGGFLFFARDLIAESGSDFHEEVAAFDQLTLRFVAGAACWLLFAIGLLVLVVVIKPKVEPEPAEP